MTYRVTYAEEAAATRDELPAEHRRLFERDMAELARDPYNEAATAAFSSPHERRANIAPGLFIEYYVRQGVLIIIVFQISDESAYLVAEDPLA